MSPASVLLVLETTGVAVGLAGRPPPLPLKPSKASASAVRSSSSSMSWGSPAAASSGPVMLTISSSDTVTGGSAADGLPPAPFLDGAPRGRLMLATPERLMLTTPELDEAASATDLQNINRNRERKVSNRKQNEKPN